MINVTLAIAIDAMDKANNDETVHDTEALEKHIAALIAYRWPTAVIANRDDDYLWITFSCEPHDM